MFEVFQKTQESKNCAYIGEWLILKEITIIDLTLANNSPLLSFFDINKVNRQKRKEISFIEALSFELSKPIGKDSKHTDYVPTQVLANYIKEQGIHGIVYESSIEPSGKNIALFFTQEHCCADDQKESNIYLKFVKKEKTYKKF